ncbi:MAG: plastocyanin/azurin family copper-binding protein [Gemmatimonadota bacterium]
MQYLGMFAAGIVAACGGGGPAGGGNNNGGNGGGAPPPPPNADVVIEIIDNAFVDPQGRQNTQAMVQVQTGQTVGWVHRGGTQHTVTSSSVPAGAANFDSGTLNRGDTFVVGAVTPLAVGTYKYFCQFHPAIMREATIVVTA